MILLIDNLDSTALLDATTARLLRKLNRPAEFHFTLAAPATPPAAGARVILSVSAGLNLFTGYVAQAAALRYAGEGERGPAYLCDVVALSDAMLLDQKSPPPSPAFVNRAAGDAFRQLTSDALPGAFDLTGVEPAGPLPYYSVDPAKKWSESAAEIALLARCSWRDDNARLFFAPLGANSHALAESSPEFSPADLTLQPVQRLTNDFTIVGQIEPSAHVTDYFVGDGTSSKFYLSQKPYTRAAHIPLYARTIVDETFGSLEPSRWTVSDPAHAISVASGQLQVAGGTGTDGQTLLTFIEPVELGGAVVLEHGDIVFSAASDGVIGGLYSGAVAIAGCVAGFRITPSGTNSSIQALIQGTVTGTPLATQPGHHYFFTTHLFASEAYRSQQAFHSSQHGAGNPRGGAPVAADVRVVLEVHDIDPSNPASQVAPAAVLYDGVLSGAPGYCAYALIDAANMQCSVAFTYLWLAIAAVVRSTLPGQATRTRRLGSLRDGAECHVSSEPALQFYPGYIPAANELIEVHYRGQGHAAARVINSASIAALRHGADDGVRAAVREIGLPAPRTSADCETAALALLDDAGGTGWTGEYRAWSQFLPGAAADIFPGDALAIGVASRAASFAAIVREVEIELAAPAAEVFRYTLRFADAGDPALAFKLVSARVQRAAALAPVDSSQAGSTYLPDLTGAAVTNVTSTTMTVDAGVDPPAGGGFEVRYTDAGWGPDNTRNLAGRYTTRGFTLTRFARSQTYFVRSYDGSVPPKYSRYSAALHVDYPL